MLSSNQGLQPRVVDILINYEDHNKIVQGLEIPANERGKGRRAIDSADSRKCFCLGSGDSGDLDVWPLGDLLPRGAELGTFSHRASDPRSRMDLGGVVGPAPRDIFVVRNSRGDLLYIHAKVLEKFTERVDNQ